jgi:phosphatidylglycerophosphate synthase
MRDASLRHKKDTLLNPIADRFLGSIHPNVISVIAMLVGLVAVLAIMGERYWLGLALWVANRILDGLDGVVARMYSKQSDFGGYLDLILDFIIYLAVPAGFVYVNPTAFNLWALALLFGVYVLNTLSWTLLSTILEKRAMQSSKRLTTIEMPAGLIEGTETIAVYTLFFLLPGQVGYLFLIFSALVLFTAGQRIWWAANNLR